jgi:vanillate O-demethylase monooxygenase subunit
MFVRNEWYGIAWSEELGRHLLARAIVGDSIVLYRTEAGAPVAFFNRCPHRSAPLSAGELRGDAITCGYHGMMFDCTGACIGVPGQNRIPAGISLRRYPVVEKYGLIWVWTGDPQLADESKLVEMPYFGKPGWTLVKGHVRFECNYVILIENLVDPAHPTFVHQRTIGHPAAADIPITTEERGDTVIAGRWINDSAPVPMQQHYGKFERNVDRWQYYYLKTPSVSRTDMGCLETGTEHTEAQQEIARYRALSYAAVTPENERVTHYYWYELLNFHIAEENVKREVVAFLESTFEEDRTILEGIQQIEDAYGRHEPIPIASDSGVMRMRRILQRRLAEEQASQVPAILRA